MQSGVAIEAVELRVVALPLVSPFVASHGTIERRTAVIVRVLGRDLEGWGECAALPEPTYSEEYVDGAFLTLREQLIPRLLAADGTISPSELGTLFSDVVGHPMAKAALELALLDAQGRSSGTSLARLLAPHPPGPSTTVRAGVALGVMKTPDALAEEVASRIAEGYGRIKLKIAPGHDIEFVRAARSAAGDDIELSVDANGAYSIGDSHTLAELDTFSLSYIEQPLATDDLLGHAELARRLTTPICLDESLTSTTVTQEALDMGACSVVCVKAPRFGSWLEAASILDHCSGLGIDAWVGGMIDCGIGRAANIALAAHPGATLTGDIAATSRFFTEDICPPVIVSGTNGTGTIAVPDGAGLGVEIDPQMLASLTERSEIFRH